MRHERDEVKQSYYSLRYIMSKLLERLQKVGTVKQAAILSSSPMFADKDFIPTELPILNIAFSGKLDGGLVPGISVIGGESKTFKTLMALYCLKAYFNKYTDSIAIIYDSEFSITPDYIKSFDIDPDRIIHIPIEHIEQMKFDMVKRLNEIERGDKVFFLIDSLGMVPSKKEVDDAVDEKSVADMTRAKSIRSLMRIICPHFTMKDIPCLVINHIYETMEMYSKPKFSGGSSIYYVANQAFIITKSMEKSSSGELEGFKFTINIEKSRFVKEKSKLPFTVSFGGGINKWSSMLDLAVESGLVVKPSNGWYQLVDSSTGEIVGNKVRAKDTECDEFLGTILKNPEFANFIEQKFKYVSGTLVDDIEDDINYDEGDDE